MSIHINPQNKWLLGWALWCTVLRCHSVCLNLVSERHKWSKSKLKWTARNCIRIYPMLLSLNFTNSNQNWFYYADATSMCTVIIRNLGHWFYIHYCEVVRKVVPEKILSVRPMLQDSRLFHLCLRVHDRMWVQPEPVVYGSWHCVITQHIVSVGDVKTVLQGWFTFRFYAHFPWILIRTCSEV